MGKMSWREISAMLGSCCSSMLFGLSFMFTKRIVGTVPAFSLLSWRFLMGAAAMSLHMTVDAEKATIFVYHCVSFD